MDWLSEIHASARALFLLKIANGCIPQTLAGGELDGLRFFVSEIDGCKYWLTEVGLLGPVDPAETSYGGPKPT